MKVELDDVLRIIDPGPAPCGCCELDDPFWTQTCDCQNSGDLTDAANWCGNKNLYNTIKSLGQD